MTRRKWLANTMAIHDMSGFGHMGGYVRGVEYYSDRALLLPVDAAVIQDDGEDLDAYNAWRLSPRVRIGPRNVIKVKSANLFEGLSADPSAMEQVKMFVRSGGRIQIFCPTPGSEEFFERHGIERKSVHAAPLEISRRMNDKAELRRIGKQCGLEQAFLPYVATHDPQTVMSAVRSFLAKPESEAEFVVLKVTNRAGGDGMLFVRRSWSEAEVEKRVVEYLREFHWNEVVATFHNPMKREDGRYAVLGRAEFRDPDKASEIVHGLFAGSDDRNDYVVVQNKNMVGGAALKINRGFSFAAVLHRFLLDQCRNEIIVEAGFAHDAFSAQVVIDDDVIRFVGLTKQIIEGEDRQDEGGLTGKHLGNMMIRFAHPDCMPEGMTWEDKVTYETWSEDLARYANTRVDGKYRGPKGFDFIKLRRNGRNFVLECNGRQTAPVYAFGINAQLEARHRELPGIAPRDRLNWGIVMYNAVATRARSWGSLTEKLGDLLFDEMYGAVPFNIRLMRQEEPHVGIVAVAPSLKKSIVMMDEVRTRLAA